MKNQNFIKTNIILTYLTNFPSPVIYKVLFINFFVKLFVLMFQISLWIISLIALPLLLIVFEYLTSAFKSWLEKLL